MLKKIAFTSFILSAFLFGGITASQAITIGINPMSQNTGIGNTVDVAVVISGLGDFASPSLGTFDLDIGFDPTILGFTGGTFGDPVLGDQLDVLGLGSITVYSDTIPGIVNIFELSLDSPDDLDNLQAGSFTLVTLTFDTLSLGNSSLGISINALGDSWGAPLSADIQSGGVNVVPEPSMLLLVGSGLVGLGYLRKRVRRR